MNQLNFNMGIGVNYGNYGNYGGYGQFGMNFGYGNMNSMMGGMLNGGNYGNYGGYGMPNMGGFGGFMGLNGSMTLPLYQYQQGKAWDTTLATSLGRQDPVYLDTNHDGKLNVEKLKQALSFDMNGDGIADQVSEWNTKDAQLVYDANGDGQINNGREMMNEVGLNGEQGKYKNGWAKALDIFDTNKDGKLDAKELEKASLWTDTNGNGKVDEGELKSVAEMGIMNIDPSKGNFVQRDKIGDMNLNFGMGMGFGMGNYGMGMGNYGMGMGNYGMGMGNNGMTNHLYNPYGSQTFAGGNPYGVSFPGSNGFSPYIMPQVFGGVPGFDFGSLSGFFGGQIGYGSQSGYPGGFGIGTGINGQWW